jgi:hypothetical protein
MASEGRRPTRNRRVAVRHVATRRFIDVLGCEQPRAVDPGKRGLGNLPATTRPRQRVQPEAAGGWVAAGSDRQSGGLADRGERGVAGVQLCALFLFGLLATWTVVASRTQALSGPCYATACWPARHPRRLLPGLLTGSPVRNQKGRQRHADRPTDLAKSIGALGSLDAGQGLAPTLQQIADSAKQLFAADGAGLMLIDAEGQLRWASASDQTAQTVEDGQERLAQGPCAVAFSQRLPAAIRDIRTEPDWAEFARVLVGEGVRAALSVPVELDGGVIGTLDVYARDPRDWGSERGRRLAGLCRAGGQPAQRRGHGRGQGPAG